MLNLLRLASRTIKHTRPPKSGVRIEKVSQRYEAFGKKSYSYLVMLFPISGYWFFWGRPELIHDPDEIKDNFPAEVKRIKYFLADESHVALAAMDIGPVYSHIQLGAESVRRATKLFYGERPYYILINFSKRQATVDEAKSILKEKIKDNLPENAGSETFSQNETRHKSAVFWLANPIVATMFGLLLLVSLRRAIVPKIYTFDLEKAYARVKK